MNAFCVVRIDIVHRQFQMSNLINRIRSLGLLLHGDRLMPLKFSELLLEQKD